ncbi:MAG: hypothetical protein AAFX78_14695 [Cyanobacteria bacterium J06638_20]
MQNLPQTGEFLEAFFGTLAQGVTSFRDGAQVTDILAFVDEAEMWRKGIEGFASNFRGEATAASPEAIDELFSPYYVQLSGAGVKPMLAYAIVNGVKSIFTIYAVSAASGQALVEG